jgi:hypothetical protein
VYALAWLVLGWLSFVFLVQELLFGVAWISALATGVALAVLAKSRSALVSTNDALATGV